MLAVLEDAVDCYQKHAHTHDPRGQQIFDEAREWVESDDRSWLFSFAASCDGLLAAWGEAPTGADVLSLGQLQDQLRARGFSVLALVGSDLDALRHIDRPAVLMLLALDGASRPVLIERLEGDAAWLRGLGSPDAVRVPLGELSAQWDRTAYVAWRNSAALPELLARGDRGESVIWLQQTLAQLGYFSGVASGEFDSATARGVRAFQRASALTPDGAVGPYTQLLLLPFSSSRPFFIF